MLKHAGDLRDHAARDGRRGADAARARQALGPRTRSRARLAELGYALDGEALDRVFARFKALADRSKQVTDADLEALVARRAAPSAPSAFALDGLQVGCGTLRHADGDGAPARPRRRRARARRRSGTGPVDAAYKAIDAHRRRARRRSLEFAVHAVTEGIDALGEVTVRVRGEREPRDPQREPARACSTAHGADTDIIVASAKAYLAALNRMLVAAHRAGGAAERAQHETP